MYLMFPLALKRFRWHLLTDPTGGNVCCVLKRSSHCRVRSSIRCPKKRAIVNALLSQFHDFVSVMPEFVIKCCLRRISASCRSNEGGHTHIQGRTASGDISGGKNISWPAMRSGVTSGLRSDARFCEFCTGSGLSQSTTQLWPSIFAGLFCSLEDWFRKR